MNASTECVPPPFIKNVSFLTFPSFYFSSIFVKKNDSKVNRYTLQYVLRYTGFKCDSHLKVGCCVRTVKMNSYQLFSTCTYLHILTALTYLNLGEIFESMSVSLMFELIPNGVVFGIKPDITYNMIQVSFI